MYNSIVIVVMILLLFVLSSDRKFDHLFMKNRGAQLAVGLILLYFATNGIDFGILLIGALALAIRYSYLNRELIAPLGKRSKVLKNLSEMIEPFVDPTEVAEEEEEEEEEEDEDRVEQIADIRAQNEQLRALFADIDEKIKGLGNK